MIKRIVTIIVLLMLCSGCKTPSEETVVVYKEELPAIIEAGKTTENETFQPSQLPYSFNIFNDPADVINNYLSNPYGIAIDTNNNLYISDIEKHKVFKFSPKGDLIGIFGDQGSYIEEFNEPGYLAIDDKNLYIADTWNHRIQILDLEGHYEDEIKDNFFGPRGVTVTDARIYVSDTGNHTIKAFDKSGTPVNSVGKKGQILFDLEEPTGLTTDNKGNLYVVDSKNNRIVKFNQELKPLKHWSIEGWNNPERGKNAWLQVYENTLYLTDPINNTVKQFTLNGKPLENTFSILSNPKGMIIKDKILYVITENAILTKKL